LWYINTMSHKNCAFTQAIRNRLFYRDGKVFRKKDGKRAGCVISKSKPYRRIALTVDGEKRVFYEHRVVWLLVNGEWPRNNIDHINRDKSDNRIENLRDCGQDLNLRNAKRTVISRTGFAGVQERPNGKFSAQAKFQGKMVWLGIFDTVGDAALAKAKFEREALNLLGA